MTEPKTSIFKQHPNKSLALLAIVFLLAMELLFRWLLPLMGYQVGNLAPYWQQMPEVDSLIVKPEFYTDSKGIYRALPDVWNARGDRINTDGFRDDEFFRDTTGTSILHIGDSFTWGANAQPKSNCYVDLLETSFGYVSYNTGIPGTDPVQYQLVADEYIPKLKPYIVAIYLYLGNDLMLEPRKPQAGKDLFYQTNVGWLPGYYNGKYFDNAAQSYSHLLNKYLPKRYLAQFICKSALGTMLLSIPLRIEERRLWEGTKKSAVPNQYLKQIAALCKQEKAKLYIFAIPNAQSDLSNTFYNEPKSFVINEYSHIFDDLHNHLHVLPMKASHYNPQPDGHFNNEGHRFAAEYVNGVLNGEE